MSALGFFIGWDKLTPWLSRDNVDSVVKGCALACSTDATYDFCTKVRTLKDAEKKEFKTTCAVFSAVDDFNEYSVTSCPALNCKKPCEEIMVNEKAGVLSKEGEVDKCKITDGTEIYDVTSIATFPNK